MANRPYRSKLNPFLEFIREARLREETWEEIAVKIGEQGTATDRSQVYKFFQRRASGTRPAGFRPAESGPVAKPVSTPWTSGPPLIEGDLEAPPTRQKLILKVKKNP